MKRFFILLVAALLIPSPALWARHHHGHAKKHKSHARSRSHAHARFGRSHRRVVSEEPVVQDEPLRDPPAHADSPVWDFWKSVIAAKEKLDQGEAQPALDLLKDLPPEPESIINRHEDFYRRLYRQALKTGLEASDQLSQSKDAWALKLWTLFPDFEGSSDVPDGATAHDKAVRMHLLFQRGLYDPIPEFVSAGEIDDCQALFELGMAHQKLKNAEEAVDAYDRVEKGSCNAKIRARALYWKGTLEMEMKHFDAAEETFDQLAKSGDGRYADDAYYHLYKMYDEANEDERAQKALHHLTELAEGDQKEKYLWDEAFAAYQQKDYTKAKEFLDQIIATRSIGTEAQPQALYWKARIDEIQSGKRLGGASAGLYRKILKTYPFSFYAIFAELRVGESAAAPDIQKLKTAYPADHNLESAIRVVDTLNRKGDHAAALDALDYLTYRAPEITKEKPDIIAQRWMESGDFNRALEMATETLDQSVFDINLKKESPLTRAMYPLAYPEEVKEAAKENGLPLGLILGIMREESLFIRNIRSHAGAVGVMQLMPVTARLKARRLGSDFSYGDLSDPAANIRLGSSFLKDMMETFGDQTALAVMAYNAGPRNVSRWIESQGDLPLDEFVENIPFTETRGYVKRVLRSEHIYGLLLGDRKSAKPLRSLDPPH